MKTGPASFQSLDDDKRRQLASPQQLKFADTSMCQDDGRVRRNRSEDVQTLPLEKERERER